MTFPGRQDHYEVDPEEIRMQLAAISELLEQRGNVVSAALLEAADEVTVEWQRHRHETERCRRLLDEAYDREREARERLARLVRVARRMATDHEPGAGVAWRAGTVVITPDHGRDADADGPDLRVHLLGPFRLHGVNDHPVDECNGSKSQRLVRYLFAQRARPVPRDVLIDQFWPEADVDTGRRRLHQTVYLIRKTLHRTMAGIECIVYHNEAYALNPALRIWADVEEFERDADLGRRAELAGDADAAVTHYDAAERRYTGDFLEDLPYEDWAIPERHRLHLLYREVLNGLGDLHERAGRLHAALLLSRRLLALDGCDEEAHRRMMRCYAAGGQRSRAVQQYRSCHDALARAFSVSPSPETIALYESLLS